MTSEIDLDLLAPQEDRIAADLASLAESYTESAQQGWTRRVFSEAYRASREWTLKSMRAAGLEAHIDPAGNVVGILRSAHNGALKPLMTGSHTDTVRGGGRFDGMVGVVGAIEVARRLQETGTRLTRDLIIIDFLGEEANEFGISCVGSRSIAGLLTAEHMMRTDGGVATLGETMDRFGLDTNRALTQAWKPGSLHGYVELHVEQGPLLERFGTSIGVVTAIAGQEQLLAHFQGRSDHAGTMPMEMRHDALAAAAQAILSVEREGCGAPNHGVSTTGRIESSPGASNVVSNDTRIWAEMRSIDSDWLHGAKRRVAEDIAAAADERGVTVMLEWLNDQEEPVATDLRVQDHIARSADLLSLNWEAVPSGAGHDAAHLTHLGPMGMIFVPSTGGRSHCPEEFSEVVDIAQGVHVLAATLINMDLEGQ